MSSVYLDAQMVVPIQQPTRSRATCGFIWPTESLCALLPCIPVIFTTNLMIAKSSCSLSWQPSRNIQGVHHCNLVSSLSPGLHVFETRSQENGKLINQMASSSVREEVSWKRQRRGQQTEGDQVLFVQQKGELQQDVLLGIGVIDFFFFFPTVYRNCYRHSWLSPSACQRRIKNKALHFL